MQTMLRLQIGQSLLTLKLRTFQYLRSIGIIFQGLPITALDKTFLESGICVKGNRLERQKAIFST